MPASDHVRTIMRRIFPLLVMLVSIAALAACGPPARSVDNGDASSEELPEVTKDIIDERINDARVYDVLPESGTGDPIPWSFQQDEPKEISVVEQHVNGPHATIILDIKTTSAPHSYVQRVLSGRISTEWQLKTGWALRRWEIVETKNISMKYRDLPKSTPKKPASGPAGTNERPEVPSR